LGGLARKGATLVDEIRKENPQYTFVRCRRYFSGTPYFNFYGGELEFKLMRAFTNNDAATIGNHDFDNGHPGLYSQLPHASFDYSIRPIMILPIPNGRAFVKPY